MKYGMLPVVIFILSYVLFVVFPKRRSLIACCGGVLMVLVGVLGWREALTHSIHWNVIALFFGTLVLAELFMQSRMPAILAEVFVDKTRTVRGAMLAVSVLSSLLSMFVENVAVVLLVAPVALSLCDKLKISPVPLLILIAVFSNLQGTATLIGDPPSMILGGYMKMSFNDFFVYHGKPGIFFAVQIGMLGGIAVAAWILRQHNEKVEMVAVEKVKSWVPTWLMLALILGLSICSKFDPDFKWLAGTITMVLALMGLFWHHFGPRWSTTKELVRTLDWDTTFFLMGIFVVVGGLTASGALDVAADWMSAHFGDSLFEAFVVIILASVLISAFVDNVPYLLAMIPVVQKLADTMEAPVPLLMFGLLIGSCLGGNVTPIGASANIVSIGMLKKRGYVVGFREFMKIGVPFTVVAVLMASVFVWLVWAP